MADSNFWRDLATQFRALPDPDGALSADWTPLITGVYHWQLSGIDNDSLKQQFGALARRARTGIGPANTRNLLDGWLDLLKTMEGTSRLKKWTEDSSGKVLHGSILRLCEFSADVCNIFESRCLEVERAAGRNPAVGEAAPVFSEPKSARGLTQHTPSDGNDSETPWQELIPPDDPRYPIWLVIRGIIQAGDSNARARAFETYEESGKFEAKDLVMFAHRLFDTAADVVVATNSHGTLAAEKCGKMLTEMAGLLISHFKSLPPYKELALNVARDLDKKLETRLNARVEVWKAEAFRIGIGYELTKPQDAQERKVIPSATLPGPDDLPNSANDPVTRQQMLAEYKAATGSPSNRQIYNARNSGIHKPQFLQWLKGKLPSTSETTKNFERFLREKKAPIPRSKNS